jgi:murein L,D-transpeptidase YafK
MLGWRRMIVRGGIWVLVSGLAASWAAAWSPDPSASGAGGLVIHVRKSERELLLQDRDQVLRRFPIVLGKQPNGGKIHRGDMRTPVGRYYISEKRPSTRFRRFLEISYPNIDDAERALGDKLIDADQWADIFFANLQHTAPPQNTLMGGRVGIHGHGGRVEVPIDWTEGCIAVSDQDIDYLYEIVPVGTTVEIWD